LEVRRNRSWRMLGAGFAILFFVLLTRSNPAAGQNPREAGEKVHPLPPQLAAELVKLREAALADEYAYRQVAHLTENIGPRPSGSPQAQKAAEYVAD
jgi:hypothetical protein